MCMAEGLGLVLWPTTMLPTPLPPGICNVEDVCDQEVVQGLGF